MEIVGANEPVDIVVVNSSPDYELLRDWGNDILVFEGQRQFERHKSLADDTHFT